MDENLYILEDFRITYQNPSYWTLILISGGCCRCTVEGKTDEYGKGLVILHPDVIPEELSYVKRYKGSVIKIPDSIVSGPSCPISQEFIQKVKENPYLDLSSESSRDDLRMATNYWFLIKEALAEIENAYARSEIMNLCIALMKFCEKHYCHQ